MSPEKSFAVMWVVFFLHGMSPGMWLPAMTNILGVRGLSAWVPLVFMVPPLCALVSPLIGSAMADQRIAADRLFAWSVLSSAVVLALAFLALDAGWHPWWFVIILGISSLLSGPSWSLLTTVALTQLSHGERQFPLVRVGATLGWIAGGLMTSLALGADTSPAAGYAAAAVKMIGGLAAFALARTPPLGQPVKALWARLGFGAFGLLKQRDHCVFFVVTAMISVPLTAFYMYAPEFLRVLGDTRPTATMTVAQVTEVACMLVLGLLMTRYRVKTVLTWALALAVARYAMSAASGIDGRIGWHVAGIAMHGLCYTFYFITAQVFLNRRVEAGMRTQAQGLLAMVASGLGPLAGAWICGWLRAACVSENGEGWEIFWGILAAMNAVGTLVFIALYRGQPVTVEDPGRGSAAGSDQLAGEPDGGDHR
jgi:hypothetical protein